jgi:HAD superfamily hydrolase (TIGR01450 family)
MTSLREIAPLIVGARGVLFDWDGCLAAGDELADGARELLRPILERVAIVSNQSALETRDVRAVLERHGIEIAPTRILLAGERTIELIARTCRGSRTLLVAAPALRRYALDAGLQLVDSRAEVVLVLRDPQVSWDVIARAAESVRDGARLVASNLDRAHPGRAGRLVPETGTIAMAIAHCAGAPTASSYGKPHQYLFDLAMHALGSDPATTVMIGDNEDTDGAGARAAGLAFVRVDAPRVVGHPARGSRRALRGP